jgi:hypothetical protein
MLRRTHVRRWAGILVLSGIISSCSVADSLYVEPAAIRAAAYQQPQVPPLCNTSLGSYALPKTFLKFTLGLDAAGKPDLSGPDEVRRSDNTLVFCLDHIADPMSDDEIRVIKSSGQVDPSYANEDAAAKTKLDAYKSQFQAGATIQPGEKAYGTQLLQWVVSNTVNQSEKIAKALVRTAFIALTGNPGFSPVSRTLGGRSGKAASLAILEYDPFDPGRSAEVNQRLTKLGFCVVLEKFTFDTRQRLVDEYCDAPVAQPSPFGAAYDYYRAAPPPRIRGIAYRPRIGYELAIYRKPDPRGRGSWRLWKQQKVRLENISPVVSVGVTRSVFAARRIALQFDKGVLQAMCLVKTSELQSAVEVPYEIAKSIVALPTEVFEVKIGNINDNIALLQAEDALIKAQKDYLDFLGDQARMDIIESNKRQPVPLDPATDKIPQKFNPATMPSSSVATLAALNSGVLSDICAKAPTVISDSNKLGVPSP